MSDSETSTRNKWLVVPPSAIRESTNHSCSLHHSTHTCEQTLSLPQGGRTDKAGETSAELSPNVAPHPAWHHSILHELRVAGHVMFNAGNKLTFSRICNWLRARLIAVRKIRRISQLGNLYLLQKMTWAIHCYFSPNKQIWSVKTIGNATTVINS